MRRLYGTNEGHDYGARRTRSLKLSLLSWTARFDSRAEVLYNFQISWNQLPVFHLQFIYKILG